MATTRTTLDVRGMTCNNCVKHVQKALAKVPGLGAVHVDLPTGIVEFEYDPAAVSLTEVTASLETAGYPATVR